MTLLQAIKTLQKEPRFNPEITGHGVTVNALHEKLPRVTYLKMVNELRRLEKDGDILVIEDGDGLPTFASFAKV